MNINVRIEVGPPRRGKGGSLGRLVWDRWRGRQRGKGLKKKKQVGGVDSRARPPMAFSFSREKRDLNRMGSRT